MTPTPLEETSKTDVLRFVRARGPHCLIIARHGETEWNAKGKMQGQQDTSLNNRGLTQAREVSRFLRNVSFDRIFASSLERSRQTARAIADGNVGKPKIIHSDFLRETALGILEGELIGRQSTAELTQHYQNFSREEIHYRLPEGGENLHDVFARVEHFFKDQGHLLEGPGNHLIVGHRNVNKMIVKYLLGLSFEDGFRVEHEHQRLYFYFAVSKELWSCRLTDTSACFMQGYATTTDGSYA